jgi:RNA polymerase sigma-70 factor, ECF subfamily
MRQLAPDELSSELERHCEYYQQRLMRRLVNLGHGKERAEDYCQDTFLRAWKHIQLQDTHLPQTDYHLENWLRIIAERIAIDENRRKKLIDFVAFPENEAHTQLPGLMVEGHEDRICNLDLLKKALVAMPPKLREPLLMQLDGYKGKEIAEILGISPGAVSMNASRAREHLLRECYPDRKSYPVTIELREYVDFGDGLKIGIMKERELRNHMFIRLMPGPVEIIWPPSE